MSLQDIAKLEKLLGQFLARFSDCFSRSEGRALLLVYVRGLLSNVQRKNAEAIAINQGARCSGFWSRSLGTKINYETAASRSSPPNTPTQTPSAVLTKQASPKAASIPQESNVSTTETVARSKTLSITSRSITRHRTFIAYWMPNSICLKTGPMIQRGEKKLHP
jgi:hypothetical protein